MKRLITLPSLRGAERRSNPTVVIPAEAGIHAMDPRLKHSGMTLCVRLLRHRFGLCLAMTVITITLLFLPKHVFAGTVTGKVNFTGTAPQMEQISMNADPVCSSLHSEPVYAETVIANSNGTIKNVFVYVKEGLEGKTFPVPTSPVTIDQKGCQYKPHVFGIQVSQPLEIINSDSTLHNIHSLAEKNKQFNLGMPIQGMKMTKKFSAPEIMAKFKCDVHPWMNAYIGVLPHPYFSVTGDDGTFEIKDVPPGDYTIEAWHEKYGVQTQKVTVTETPSGVEFTFNG